MALAQILQVDYRLGVTTDNTAPAGQPLAINLDVHHLAGASASSIGTTTLWYSTDGRTWQTTPLRQRGNGQDTATLPASALVAGSSISLQVHATDHNGNSIDQTLTNAVPVTT